MAVTPNGNEYSIIVNGTNVLGIPNSKLTATDTPLMIYAHGANGGYRDFTDGVGNTNFRNWLIDNGWAWAECAGGGGLSWGNQAARDAYENLYAWVKSTVSIGPVVTYGVSMGGLVTYWLGSRSSTISPATKGIVILNGTTDLEWRVTYQNPSGVPSILSAYNAISLEDFYVKSADYDPMQFPESYWRDRKILLSYSPSDTAVPPTNNSLAWINKYGGVADVRTATTSQGHGTNLNDPVNLNPILAFMEAVIEGVNPPNPEPPEPPDPLKTVRIDVQKDNVVSYSTQEDATPLSLASGGGGLGQLTYTRPNETLDETLIDLYTSLRDEKWGDFEGVIRDISDTDGLTSIVADSALAKLNLWYTVPPYEGTLAGYLAMLSSLVGVIINTDTQREYVEAPGYLGNVWEGFKEFLIVNKLEVAQVGGRIVVRELREFDSFYNHNTTESWNLNSQSTAEKVRVYWRDIQRRGNNIEVYAPEQHFVVDAGAIVVQEVTIPGSITRVNQPQVLDYVPANTDYTGSVGAYCVSGKDGKPILAERWIAGGGSLRVKTTDDPSVIQIIITGSHAEEYAPYQIAATAGTSNYYNSLHITGDGMYWEKKDILVHTGAPRSATSAETPVEIDSINITSLDKAYSVALAVGKDYVGGLKSITGTSVSLNRPEDRPNKRIPLFDDFNQKHGSMTFAQFNSEYAGMSFGDFNKAWEDSIAQSIENQAFGQVIGARARRGEAMYRIDALTTTPNNMQYTLKMDTTFEDFNKEYGTMTFEEFNGLFAGYRFRDFNNRSLQGGK